VPHDEEELVLGLGNMHLQPPPIPCSARWMHGDCETASDPDSPSRHRQPFDPEEPPVYRSAPGQWEDVSDDDEYESAVYRSCNLVGLEGTSVLTASSKLAGAGYGKAVVASQGFGWASAEHSLASTPLSGAVDSVAGNGATECFTFELPNDIFHFVLALLAAPELFHVMGVCRSWWKETRAYYLQERVTTVPSAPGALLHAVARARAGDTLRLLPGMHQLPMELTLERPVRLLSCAEADRMLAAYAATVAAPHPSEASTSAPCTHAAETAGAGSSHRGDPDVVLHARLHVLLRTRCSAFIAGITFCRMGDEVGYPNAVAYAEVGRLQMERCRITCGGPATSVSEALQAFAGVPPAVPLQSLRGHSTGPSGGPSASSKDEIHGKDHDSHGHLGHERDEHDRVIRPSRAPTGSGASSASAAEDASVSLLPPLPSRQVSMRGISGDSGMSDDASALIDVPTPLPIAAAPRAPPEPHDGRSQCPQSGVWVGAAALVQLQGCTIAACRGPGVKIYRGRLEARENTIALSSCGANVVANGGHVMLEGNQIAGANGDGVSSWNNSRMHIKSNVIHSNAGAGIAVNTGYGSVTILNNVVYANAFQPLMFATSTRHMTIRDNTFDGEHTREGPPAQPPHLQTQDSDEGRSSPLPELLLPLRS